MNHTTPLFSGNRRGFVVGLLIGLICTVSAAFAINTMQQSWTIQNTAISVSGRLEVHNLDGTEVYNHDWGQFVTFESKNWTMTVKNIGGDYLSVAWWTNGTSLPSGWDLKAYYGFTPALEVGAYPQSFPDQSGRLVDDANHWTGGQFIVGLQPQQQIYVEFVLAKTGASANLNFQIQFVGA